MKEDTIGRQQAIEELRKMAIALYGYDATSIISCAIYKLQNLPSAEPERLTDDDFETIRGHLNAYKEKLCNQRRWKEAEEYQRIIDRFMAFAQSDDAALHETCTDCPLYDHDKHSCPRFNKVIPTTIQEIMDTQSERKKGETT